ncbi:MAG: SDR family oxidoreductase [Bacteroidales bacterium]
MATIVITGISKGIGRALTDYFLSVGGHHVIGLSRGSNLMATEGGPEMDAGAEFTHVELDMTEEGELEGFIRMLKGMGIRPDVLINNAGMMLNKPFGEITGAEVDEVLAVNFRAPFLLTRMLLPLMNRPAHIVNISSMGGIMGSVKFPGLSLYSASKGALSILTEALAEELKEEGISVNALAPGSVQTEMLEEVFPGYKAPVTPEEMASFIGHFALTGHRFFNGKVLPVAVSTP